VINSGGHLAPGSGGAGSLTLQNLSLNTGSILDYNAGPAAVSATLAIPTATGGETVNLPAGNTLSGTYSLFTYGTLANPFSAADFAIGSGSRNNFSYVFANSSSGEIDLIITSLAGSSVWTAGGANANWSNAANWGGSVPGTDGLTNLVFSTSGSGTTVNDFVSAQFAGINFTTGASAFTLTGNSIGLLGDLVNNSSMLQTVNLNLALPSGVVTSFKTTPGGGDLLVGGVIFGGSAAGLNVTGGGAVTLTASNTLGGSVTISAGTLQLGNGGTTGSIDQASGVTDNGTLVFNRSDSSVTFAVNITGSGAVVQSGSGTLVMAGSNSYTGGTSFGASLLRLGNATAIGTGALTTNGGTLDLAGYSPSVGPLSSNNPASLVTTTSAAQVRFTTTLTGGNSTTYAGNLTDGVGTLALAVAGSGELLLTGNNSFSGGATISGATLQMGSAFALGNAALAPLTVNSGVLDLQGFNLAVGSLSGAAGTIFSSSAGSTSVLTINMASGATSYGGVLADGSGVLALAFGGSGVLTLYGNNTYSGSTSINGGTLQIGRGATGEGLASSYIVNNGALIFSHADSLTYSGAISGSGSLTKIGAGTLTLAGTAPNTYTGLTTVSGAGTILQLEMSNSAAAFGGNVLVSNTGVNNFAAVLASAAYPGNIPPSTVFTFSTGTVANAFADLALQDGDLVVAGISSTSSFAQIRNGWAYGAPTIGSATLTVNNSNNYTYAGTLGDGWQAGSVLALTKSGNGLLVLSGTVGGNFSGDVAVDGGVLALAASYGPGGTVLGARSNSRTINVNPGGTLLFAAPNVYGQFSSTTVPTLNIDGGLVTNADPTGSGAVNNALNDVILTDGTLSATTGQNTGYGAWNINGTITSSGNSWISTTDPVHGTVMLNSTAGSGAVGKTTFNVVDGTLTVSAPLVQAYATDGDVSGLLKTGTGTMVLSGTNTYTGGTTVEDGTLVLTNSKAVADGTDLTVGDPLPFQAAVVPSVVANDRLASAAPVTPVPEPSVLVLLAAVLGIASIYSGIRKQKRRVTF
jgi:autotransporter-associated beta strand protein